MVIDQQFHHLKETMVVMDSGLLLAILLLVVAVAVLVPQELMA
jgi:hypothetical protein